VDNHFLLRISSHRWALTLGLLAAISVASTELAAPERPDCTAQRALEELALWLTSALPRPIPAPIHGL